jgi:hypothetical protein
LPILTCRCQEMSESDKAPPNALQVANVVGGNLGLKGFISTVERFGVAVPDRCAGLISRQHPMRRHDPLAVAPSFYRPPGAAYFFSQANTSRCQ